MHQLERIGRRWRCTRCTWEWARPPVSVCPGVPRYAWWPAIPEHLNTQTQLKRKGLAPAGPISGCVASRHGWFWLYDIHQARVRRGPAPAQADALARGRATQECRRRAQQEAVERIFWEEEEATERHHAGMLAEDRMQAQCWARDLLERSDWLVLDTETTGLEDDAEIVQLGVLAPDGQVLLDTLVRPTKAIPADATVIHGITDAAVVTAPTFSDVYLPLLEACANKQIVTYNAAFDRAILDMACSRAGLAPLRNRWDCAMEHYAAFCGDWSAYHGDYRWLPLPGAGHRASDDCRAVLNLIAWLAAADTRAYPLGMSQIGSHH